MANRFTNVRPKTAEPIEMPFGLRTRMGSRNYVLDGAISDPHTWRGNFEAKRGQPRLCPNMISGRYTESDSERGGGRIRYGADADWVHIGTTWRIRLNRMCVLRRCGLTSDYFGHLLNLVRRNLEQ